MTGPLQIVRQRDFSGGELVEYAKRRDDEPAVRAGTRTLRNVRLLSSGSPEQRPGRSIIFQNTGRVDEIRMDSDTTVFLCFGDDGALKIRNSSGAVLAQAWGYAWDRTTAGQAVVTRADNDLVITFDGQVPKIARWDGGTGWTFLNWTAAVTPGGQKRVPFLRIAPKGITLLPSGRTGSINLTFSDDVLVSGMEGTRIRFCGRQIEIATATSPTTGTGTVKEPLPGSQALNLSTNGLTSIFALGEIVEGSVTGSKGIITSLATGSMTVQLISTEAATTVLGVFNPISGSAGFTTADTVTGPAGAFVPTSVGAIGNPAAVTMWDEEVFNDFRGWPRSCASDQSRLIFCDFPAVPDGIAWSAALTFDDFHVGADPVEAMFETVPRKARIYHVTDGADEFVFTDLGVYYIPISETNPLRPGSVAFKRIPGAPASSVRPVSTAQGVVYANAANNRVLGIVGTGQTAQPYLIRPASDLQSHLFDGITCLAVEDGGGDPPDELVYAVNGDGTVVVGRYQPGKDWAGWVLWHGDGQARWISVASGAAVFSTQYGNHWVTERVDADVYLEACVSYDAIPSALGTGAQAAVFIGADQGTVIGDMTNQAGLAAAFNGVMSATTANCASKTSTSPHAAVGKTLGQAMRIGKAEVWPSSDTGFAVTTPIEVQLRGKTGSAPVSYGSDGTQLATTGSIANTTAMQTLTSSDLATEWDHAWVVVTVASGATFVAEVKLYSAGAVHGSGELWFLPSKTVDVMDGRRVVGTATTDANGEVTLSAEALAGQELGYHFNVSIEPFIPHVGPGQAALQTMHPRQITRGAVAVQNSTGFKVQSYNPNTAAWQDEKGRPAYNASEDDTLEPTAREEVVDFTIRGSNHDPRIRIFKDYGGPLRVLELGVEVEV